MLTKDDLNQIEKIVEPLAKDLKEVKKRVKKIEKTTDVMIKTFDEGDTRLNKRVTKIEERLGFTSKN